MMTEKQFYQWLQTEYPNVFPDELYYKCYKQGALDFDDGDRSETWRQYSSAYFNRYGVEPVRNAKANAIISQLHKRIGGDAVSVVAYFVESSNAYYVRRGHSLACCLADCESLRTQWASGMRVTETSARQKDATQANSSIVDNLMAKHFGVRYGR